MPDGEEPRNQQEKRGRYEENVPSSRILKLAILAAVIIVIIAIVIYLKARHAPPALHDQLRVKSGQSFAMNRLPGKSAMPMDFREALWSPHQLRQVIHQMASQIQS